MGGKRYNVDQSSFVVEPALTSMHACVRAVACVGGFTVRCSRGGTALCGAIP